MRSQLAIVMAVVALAAGCEADRDTGAVDNVRSGTDTMIESEVIRDTTIVTADTNIDVDTIKDTDHIEDDRD